MKKYILILLIIAVGAVSAPAQSDDVQEYELQPLRTKGVKATPIGVDEMKYIGTQYISGSDSTYMRYITTVVRYDVDFYADLVLIPIDSFYVKMYEIRELDLLAWRRLGAQYVVRLEAEFPGRNMRVRWRVFDASRGQRMASGQIEKDRNDWRQMAHEISDEIVQTLTGNPGLFHTRVVYVKQLKNAKELFISDYDGANERQLTKNGSINISPDFSPDGRMVYFVSYVTGRPQLHKVDVFTGETTQISKVNGMIAAPAVSPDGKKVACVISESGNADIHVLDTAGNRIKQLTNRRSIESAPTWSPDGRQIAYSSDATGAPQLYIMDADGIESRRLTWQSGYNDSPVWSQRGDRITFVSRTKTGRFNLCSIDTSGQDYRVLTDLGTNENPHFSPDGKHIVFSSTRLGGSDIFTMDVNGRNQRRLTRTTTCSNPIWGPLM